MIALDNILPSTGIYESRKMTSTTKLCSDQTKYRNLGSNDLSGTLPSSTVRPAFSKNWTISAPSGYTITEHLLGEPPLKTLKFRILCLGAGASGIDFLHHSVTLQSFKDMNVEIVCYERNMDVGGTWLENRYDSSREQRRWKSTDDSQISRLCL